MNLILAAVLTFTPDYSAIRSIPTQCATAAAYTMAATGLYDYINTVRHVEKGWHETAIPARYLGNRNIIGIGLLMAAWDFGITRMKSPALRCAGELNQTLIHINATVWTNSQ